LQQAATLPEQPKKKAKQERTWEDQLFLTRLRRHMKWVFVLLAIVFALGFVVFGVGTGSGNGSLGDVLRNLFGKGSSHAPTLAEAQQKVDEHPNDPNALHDLAIAQQNAQQHQAAAETYEKYLKLRPSDAAALRLLGANYGSAAASQRALASQLQSQSGLLSSFTSNACQFQNTSGFLNAACENPIEQAESSAGQAKANDATTQANKLYTKEAAAYARLAKLTPNDPFAYTRWGSAAQQASNMKEALTAYNAFLQRFPNDPDAARVRDEVTRLKAILGSDSVVG
jgi:regulator of sirC expression with transglutaminase-like and TPR domain